MPFSRPTVLGAALLLACGTLSGGTPWPRHALPPVTHVSRDFDGDGRTDAAVARLESSTYVWYILRSLDGDLDVARWGVGIDLLMPGDYDGDGRSDPAVYRLTMSPPSLWYVLQSASGTPLVVPWGLSSDNPLTGDFDGDGQTDPGVFRSASGVWYVRRSSDGGMLARAWGANGDRQAPGDYDGDGFTDFGVHRSNMFFLLQSQAGFAAIPFGLSTDIVAPVADYDGDHMADLAVVRNVAGQFWWYIRKSTDGSMMSVPFGATGDRLVEGDYDGDGFTDVAVWRPSTATFYIRRSSDGGLTVLRWGIPSDTPIGGRFCC